MDGDALARLFPGLPGPMLLARPVPMPDACAIPPREWLLGTRLVRRFVSLLVAPGGVGKSALAVATAVSLAAGRNILGEHVHHSVPCWLMNLEDPADELNRRLAACMALHGIGPAELRGRLFTHTGRDRRLVMAEAAEGGVAFPDQEAVLGQVRERGIGLVVVDPFVKSHALDENSNIQMDLAVTAWAEVADQGGCAVLLVHHTRKVPAGGDGGADAARGAKAVVDAARSAVLLTPMEREEAAQLDVPEAERWRYVRMDDAKANLAPRGAAARWLRLDTVPLGNATEAYLNGDQVAAVKRWEPVSPWAGHTVEELNRVLDVIAEGPVKGSRWAPHRRGTVLDRWGGKPLMAILGVSEAMAAVMLATWLRSGLLEAVTYRDPHQRRDRHGLQVVDAKRPGRTLAPAAHSVSLKEGMTHDEVA